MEDLRILVKDEKEEKYHISQLLRYGYKQVANCYWCKIYKKDGCRQVIIEKDF
jgi:hypothetical protein